MKRRKQQGNKRRYEKSKPSDGSPEAEAEGNNSNSMADVMAQLRLQRQKAQSKVTNAAETEARTKCNIKKSVQNQEIGKFRFDPITNRYLPKSSFHKSGRRSKQRAVQNALYNLHSNATQKQVKTNAIIDRLRWKTHNSVTDEAVRRVIFRGSTISTSLEQKADSSQVIPCSERSIQLLLTSRSYCRSSQRRDDIVNIIGPIAIARGAEVIPAAVTEDILRTNTRDSQSNKKQQHAVPKKQFQQPHINAAMNSSSLHNQMWYSLLRPIIPSRKIILQPELSTSTPYSYDCMCKSYLPPNSSTFDIRSHPNALPSVVTLANEEIFCRQKEPIHSNGRRAFKTGDPHCTHSAWELPGSAIFDCAGLRKADRKYQCVRFSHSTNHIGIVASDVNMNYYFAYKNIFRRNEPPTHTFSDLEGPVNDFCFSPNGKVANLICC